jgi:phosphate transport system protein
MRDAYIQSLNELSVRVTKLGEKIEGVLAETWKALSVLDIKKADQIYRGDDDIDDMVRDYMKRDLTLGVTQSPVATDWRNLMSTFKILSDLERIADHCSDISHYIGLLGREPERIKTPQELDVMYSVMAAMVRDSVKAYAEGDDVLAEQVRDRDDIVDAAFARIMDHLAQAMETDSRHVRQYMDYILIVKYIERMADHSVNIANWVLYRVRNQIVL